MINSLLTIFPVGPVGAGAQPPSVRVATQERDQSGSGAPQRERTSGGAAAGAEGPAGRRTQQPTDDSRRLEVVPARVVWLLFEKCEDHRAER